MSATATSGPRTLTLDGTIQLAGGGTLAGVEVAYETFGTLDHAASNAMLVCHALSGDAHVASGPGSDGVVRPGWWDDMVGPGHAIDTGRYFVICANVLGGCSGTTGPAAIDPQTGRRWGLRFPLVTVEDMVDVQARLLDALGVTRLLAVVGGSMGGMQALAWAARYPDRVDSVVAAATTARLGAQAIAFNEVGRAAILADPAFEAGDYAAGSQPADGLAIARMVGHITYLSQEGMREKFGRRLRHRDEHAFDFVTEFEVESYLAYQGRRFVERFDANTYLYMTKAMDYFDWRPPITGPLPRFLVLSFTSDWLFTTAQARETVRALLERGADVSFAEIDSPYGHDAFLLETERQGALIGGFLDRARAERAGCDAGGAR
ncbi:MAG: homoserine O-acetyltransferase MetX [Coriobacteriia bacterium]